jgi:hypothetical protein
MYDYLHDNDDSHTDRRNRRTVSKPKTPKQQEAERKKTEKDRRIAQSKYDKEQKTLERKRKLQRDAKVDEIAEEILENDWVSKAEGYLPTALHHFLPKKMTRQEARQEAERRVKKQEDNALVRRMEQMESNYDNDFSGFR